MDFGVLELSECCVLAPSLMGGGLGRVGADVGRVVCVALAGLTAAGFLGGPAVPNGEEVLATRAVGLAAAAFPSNRFGAIRATILTTRGLQRSDQVSRTPMFGFGGLGWGNLSGQSKFEQRRCLGNTWYLNTCTRVTQIQA